MPNGGDQSNGRGNQRASQTLDPNQEIMNANVRMLTTMTENFALNNAVMRVPTFDGKTPELKNFLQDLRNAQLLIEPGQQAAFVTAIMGRLSGPARDCCYGRTFNDVPQLIAHLKRRFVQGMITITM